MSRHARLRIAGCPLHLIQRGVNRSACFAGEDDYRLYLGLLGEIAARHSCAVHAYVLMTNHVHLLLTADEPEAPSSLMKHLGQRYVQSFNRRHKRTGTLWEGRFKSSIVDSEAYFLRCQRYVEANPVRAGMIAHARDYPWSSYRSNAEGLASTFLTPHAAYLALGPTTPERLASYRALFGSGPSSGELEMIRAAVNAGLPLGRAEFVESLGRRLNRRVAFRPEGRPSSKTGDRPQFPSSGN
jgi:putative transposase